MVDCPTCQGSGEIHTRGSDPQTQEDYDCPTCQGMGVIYPEIDIHNPQSPAEAE